MVEKHIIRIPVKYVESGINDSIPEHKEYITQVTQHLKKNLIGMINTIIEEHQNKHLIKPSYGVEANLFEELNQQICYCQKAAQYSINREKTINEIKELV